MGQFGTGMVSTGIVSLCMEVEGAVKNSAGDSLEFKVTIDRTGSDGDTFGVFGDIEVAYDHEQKPEEVLPATEGPKKYKMALDFTLKLWLHPSVKVPFKFDADDHEFYVSPDITDNELMEQCEDVFLEASKKAPETRERPVELQVTMLWNTKDHTYAMLVTNSMAIT